jgi:hypothetical protein
MTPRKHGLIDTFSWATVVLCGACVAASPRTATHGSGSAPSVTASSEPRPAAPALMEPARDELLDGSDHPAVPSLSDLGSGEPSDENDVELVVDSDVVARCPALRFVRRHVEQFDPDLVWVAVLGSIAECMSAGGPMQGDTIEVSGTEAYRHVVRQVLRSRGISPVRVLSSPPGAAGMAECQGSSPCAGRVEITVSPSP